LAPASWAPSPLADAEEDTFLNGHKTVWGSWYDTEAKK